MQINTKDTQFLNVSCRGVFQDYNGEKAVREENSFGSENRRVGKK
jgi:hypothetical protein